MQPFKSFKYKSILLSLLAFCFIITPMCISSVYAQINVEIREARSDDIPFNNGQPISISESSPLFFSFVSTESVTFTCKILRVDDTIFNQVAGSISDINVVGTEVSSRACGSGESGDVTYTQSLSDANYVFQVIGTPSSGPGETDEWAFQISGGQAQLEGEGSQPGSDETINADEFWKKCNNLGDNTNVMKVVYTMEGRSKIDKLKFDSNTFNLKVETNKNTNAINGEFRSDSSEKFNIRNLNTECIYHLPEKAGESEIPAPTVAFNSKTLAAWNPPVPTCGGSQFERVVIYPFKVTSNLAELKDTHKRNVEVEITVDATPKPEPKHSGVDVTGKLILNGKKEINIQIDGEPKVECSGLAIVG